MLVQVVIECAGRTERRDMDVSNGIVTIGRAPTCSLSFESALVSRNHASIDLNGGAMRVPDSPTNGTLAGSVFVQGSRAEVPFGVPIVVGEYTVWLRAPEKPPAFVPPPGPAPPAPRAPEIALTPTIAPPSVIIADEAAAHAEGERKDAAAQVDRA